MNKAEALKMLDEQLASFRAMPYDDLTTLIDSEPTTGEVSGPSNKKVQYEIEVLWDDKPGGNVRVIGNIDDGGWRAYFPLGNDFIKSPDNTTY